MRVPRWTWPRRRADASAADRHPDAQFDLGAKPRHERRPVDGKWLATLVLFAGTATLLLGMVWGWLGAHVSFTEAPEYARRTGSGPLSARADRLAVQPPDRGLMHGEVEQLVDDAPGLERFHYVMVRLAQAVDSSFVPKRPAQAAAASNDSSIAADPALPPEIRFGTSRPEPRTDVSAYADEVPAQSPALPGVPINLSVIAKSDSAETEARHVIVARRGDTLAGILGVLGVSAHDADAIAALLTPSWFGRASFTGGEVVTVLQDVRHDARPWEVDVAARGKPARVAVLSDEGTYIKVAAHAAVAMAPPAADEMLLRPALDVGAQRMKLDESLSRLSREHQLSPSLAHDIAQLCARDGEGETAIARGDAVEVLYRRTMQRRPVLAFAAVTLNGLTHRYYRFKAPDDGSSDFYDPNGDSVTEMLMKKPVADGHLGDGFGWRIHPILHDRRFHEGVDYAAPYGSPIVAAGDGVIEKIGEEWGYGKFVRIRHDFGYETTYAHISAVVRGLKVGDRIHRGEPIAYVGSTGLSTGPHLYYELRVNDRYVDPLAAHLRAGRVLAGDALAAFQRWRRRADRLIQVAAQNRSVAR